jgi:hypothetical protein
MTQTGVQIFKLLPQTNCSECGMPTCIAFAMGIISGSVEAEWCPHIDNDLLISLEKEFSENRQTYLKEEQRHVLIGKKVDRVKLNESHNWSTLNEAEDTYWTFWTSFSGCDQHSITLVLFISIKDEIIDEVGFNVSYPDEAESNNLKSFVSNVAYELYQDRTCQITTDIRTKVTDLVEEILLIYSNV